MGDVLIIGDYGRYWESLPVTVTREGRTFIFADHRTPVAKIATHTSTTEIFVADEPRQARLIG